MKLEWIEGAQTVEIVRAAGALIDYASVALVWCLRGHYLRSRAMAWIGDSFLSEHGEIMLIDIVSPALHVRTVDAPLLCTSFIPVEAEPSEVILQLQSVFHPASLRVEVFYAQKPCPALALR